MSVASAVSTATNSPEPSFLWKGLRWFLLNLIVLVLYLGMAGVGLEMALWQQFAPLIWPPAGFALLVVLRGGLGYLPSIVAGAFIVKLFEGTGLTASLLCAASYGLAAFVARDLLLRVFKIQFGMERMQDVLVFIGFGVVVTPLFSSFVTTATICQWQQPFCPNFGQLFAVRWLSDALGVLVVTPMLLVWYARTRMNWRNAQAIEVLVWLAALIFLGAMIFRNWAPTDTLRYPLELTMFPLMAWASIRFGQRGTTVGIFIVSMMAVWELRDVIGPDATRTITQPPGYLWVFVGVLSSTSLILSAVLTEVRNREDQAKANEERLRAFITAMPDLAFVIDEEGRYLEVFAPKSSAFAERAPLLVGKRIEEIYESELAQRFLEVVTDVANEQSLKIHRYTMDYRGQRHWFEGRVAPLDGTSDGLRAVVWVAYDVTASHIAQKQLEERDRILAVSTRVDQLMLQSQKVEEDFTGVLEALGQDLDLDRVQLWRREETHSEEHDVLVRMREWAHAQHRESPEETPTRLNYVAPFPQWLTECRQHQFVELANEDIPEALAPELRSGRPTRLALLPLRQGKQWWGFLAMGPKVEKVPWSGPTTPLLIGLANGLSASLDNQAFARRLQVETERANRANAAKSMFLAMMSHEIRTPMNAILGFTDILKQSKLEKEQSDYLSIISRSGRDLLTLINNILDFSKLESESLELEELPFDLETVIIEALETNLGKAKERGLRLNYVLSEGVTGALLGDPLRLRQILLNLLSNAIKFTRDGHVQVRAQTSLLEDGRVEVRLAVEDTGIGISPEKKEILFEPFTQADSSTTREYGGTGLGLSICRRLIERMKGQIWIDSVVGSGTTFFLVFSVPQAEGAAPTASGTEQDHSLDPEFAQAHPHNILIVEDDPINRHMAQTMLQRLGYRPHLAANGREALAFLEANTIDLLLLDLQMPEMDGFATVEAMRKAEMATGHSRRKVIALTAMALSNDEERCKEAGMDGFIAKPFTPAQLKDALRDSSTTTEEA